MELRPYQTECVEQVLEAYERYRMNPCKGDRAELVVLPTGSGKTVVFSHVIHELNRRYSTNALIIAHRDELLDQAADKYRMVRPEAIIGKVGSGVHQYGGEVTVASIATIARPNHLKNLKALYGVGKGLLIIVDESHHSASASYQKVLQALPEAFALMVTATPKRLDGKQILEKAPLYQRTIIEMIADGYLCNVRAIAIKTEVSLDEVKSLAGDFNEHDLDLAVNTPVRNLRVVNAYLEHGREKRAICFAVTVNHAQALAYAFNDMGIEAAVIEGGTPHDERRKIYQAFRAGTIKILCNVMVLTEGFDEPRAEVAIMARPTQSESLYVQQVGRVLRLAPGKHEALILDLTDNSQRLRLAPQNLKRAIGLNLKDNELILDAVERLEDEEAEKEAREKRSLIRKLNERREKDVEVSLFGLPEWQERENGLYVMEVGPARHRLALVPLPGSSWSQLYDVCARLAPDYVGQRWLKAQSLDTALQYAEKRARQLLEDPGSIRLLDQNADWRYRDEPITEKQMKTLKWYHIPFGEGTNIQTKAQASKAIGERKDKIEKHKADKAARDAEKQLQTQLQEDVKVWA